MHHLQKNPFYTRLIICIFNYIKRKKKKLHSWLRIIFMCIQQHCYALLSFRKHKCNAIYPAIAIQAEILCSHNKSKKNKNKNNLQSHTSTQIHTQQSDYI